MKPDQQNSQFLLAYGNNGGPDVEGGSGGMNKDLGMAMVCCRILLLNSYSIGNLHPGSQGYRANDSGDK